MSRSLAVHVGILMVGLTVTVAGCGGGGQNGGSGGSAGGATGSGGAPGTGGLGVGGGRAGTGGTFGGTGGRGGAGGGTQVPRTAAECAYAAAGGAGGDNFAISVDGVTVRFDRSPSGAVTEAGINSLDALRIHSTGYITGSSSYVIMTLHVLRGTTSGTVACGPVIGSGFDTAEPFSFTYVDHCGGFYSTARQPESCAGTFTMIPQHPGGGRLVGTFTATVGKTGSGIGPNTVTFTGTVDIPITPL